MVTASNVCPLANIIVVTRCKGLFAKGFLHSEVTIAVGDDATSLAPLIVLDLAFVKESTHISPKIIVAVVNTPACIEFDINEDDASFNRIGIAIVSDLKPLGGVNLGTVGASDGGHLLNTACNKIVRRRKRGCDEICECIIGHQQRILSS
jgi:hypothetical protein